MTNEIHDASANCEIRTERIVSFAREIVFKAWTDPEHLKNWWGPKGFTNTIHEYDLKPGGKWKFTMHGPDRGNYTNECVFIKINAPEFVAWNHISNPNFQVETKFEELHDEKTLIIFKMIFNSPGESDKVRSFAVEKNEENLDRLEVELKKMIVA